MDNVTQIEHAVMAHHITRIRDEQCDTTEFRGSMEVIGNILALETLRSLATNDEVVQTPLAHFKGKSLSQSVVIVPILRAGLALVEPFTRGLPDATVIHLGMYRDEETATPVWYYNKLENELTEDVAIIVDPMLATGGSLIAAIDELKQRGINSIRVASVIAAPEGINAVVEKHPNVEIYVCDVDSHLNDRAFIVPGLGDAGDRYFGTTG